MAGSGKKEPALVSRAGAYALGKLSKAALIDLCVDMARRMEGADEPEGEILRKLRDNYLPTVCRIRGQKVPDLVSAFDRWHVSYTHKGAGHVQAAPQNQT